MSSRLSNSDCIPWLAVLICECLCIVILNIITIIVFVKQPQLQRRSTYLIIHLAIVDLLVGAVSGPLQIHDRLVLRCELWNSITFNFWSRHVILALFHLFSFTSLVNLVFVSLERLHATFCPFRHRFVKKWIYGVIITVIWLTTTARESVQIILKEKKNYPRFHRFRLVSSILSNFSFSYLCLLYSNCCKSSMQSSSISPWCSQLEGTKTDRYLAHCCSCVSIMLFASDNTVSYGDFL